jgi:glycosyltransferase involved in cell wall biosynthesis
VQGLVAFLKSAWPMIRATVAGAKLQIVGLNPSEWLTRFINRSGAQLCANAEYLDKYYSACDIVIAPILFGSGTRVKLIESMAFGRPIISTRIGAEGLSLVDGHTALLVDDILGFVPAAQKLANDPKLRSALADAAWLLQQQLFSSCSVFDKVLRKMIEQTSTERSS